MGQVWEAQVGKGFTKKKGSPRIWFIQSQPEARVCHSLPERERKVRSGGPSAVSLGTQGHGPLFRLRTGGASLWDQIKTLIEGNFQREWFKLFLVRSAIFKCSLEVLISILSLQIKIIMFSKGPVVYCGEGSLACINEASRSLEVFSYLEGKFKPGDSGLSCPDGQSKQPEKVQWAQKSGTFQRHTFSPLIRGICLPKCFKSKRTF